MPVAESGFDLSLGQSSPYQADAASVASTQPDVPSQPGALDQAAKAAGLSHLLLTSFRSYRDLSLDLGLDPVVITGPNGAGKTNILEAISFLAPGSGLRQANIGDIDFRQPRNHAGGISWAVHARYRDGFGEHALGTGRDPLSAAQTGRERRISRINGANIRSQAAFAEIMSVIWLTPQMDRLFLEPSSARRRFLDRLVSALDPGHASRVGAYEQAMRERQRLLRGEGPAARPGEMDAWLSGLEIEMAAGSVAIAAARLDSLRQLNGAMQEAIGPFPRARLELLGALEDWLGEMPALEVEDRLRAALENARAEDTESGITRWGAHRSDFAAFNDAKQLSGSALNAVEASTGEQKALLVAIILAQTRLSMRRRGVAPLLLLDEVAAHLDPERRAHLLAELSVLGAQCWLTGTERDLFRPMAGRAQFFAAGDGRLLSEQP